MQAKNNLRVSPGGRELLSAVSELTGLECVNEGPNFRSLGPGGSLRSSVLVAPGGLRIGSKTEGALGTSGGSSAKQPQPHDPNSLKDPQRVCEGGVHSSMDSQSWQVVQGRLQRIPTDEAPEMSISCQIVTDSRALNLRSREVERSYDSGT